MLVEYVFQQKCDYHEPNLKFACKTILAYLDGLFGVIQWNDTKIWEEITNSIKMD